MGLTWQCDIFCDLNHEGCKTFSETGLVQQQTEGLAKLAWEHAQALGWKRIRGNRGILLYVCPNCAKIGTETAREDVKKS